MVHYFFGEVKPRRIWTDSAPELIKACTDLGYLHDTCTPHRPQSNGVAERQVRKVKEGTRCMISQSGLHAIWWHYAMRCFCYLQNILERTVPVKTKKDEGDNSRDVTPNPVGETQQYITPYQARFQE